MLKTDSNAGGLPRSVFDDIRGNVATNRSQFYKDLSGPFFGANGPGSTVTQGLRDQLWLQSMQVGLRGAFECVKAFSESDFTRGPEEDRRPVSGQDHEIEPERGIAAPALRACRR
jgi:non-heme chloroperoxidase